MSETDWREILSFSQKELIQADKEKLCESLSWMEADDIELNFTDLKTLFRLAQDILKYKTEQVNNLQGRLATTEKKKIKSKMKESYPQTVSPAISPDSVLETITHQEEVIKANREILEQLYADIAELEEKKSSLEEYKDEDKDSESSRDVLSELNEVVQLENEVTMKNRHIRKLLGDVKVLEEQNTKLKEKVTELNDKLTEATKLIETLTEQIFTLNSECAHLKEALGKSEEMKSHQSMEIESLKKELSFQDKKTENIYEEIQNKVQHWKNIAKSKKTEIETLSNENILLKEKLIRASQRTSSPKNTKKEKKEELKLRELQDKLLQATKEIEQSANIIETIKAQNRQLKADAEDPLDYPISENKNECDDYKEKSIINKLKRKVKYLTSVIQETEERLTIRDKELADLTSQLQLVQSDEGIKTLLEGLKNKKRLLKCRDEGIKSLVQEVNTLNQLLDDLQLENETLRQTLNIPRAKNIPTTGILKKYRETERKFQQSEKKLKRTENQLVSNEFENRSLVKTITKMTMLLKEFGYDEDKINELNKDVEHDERSIDEQKTTNISESKLGSQDGFSVTKIKTCNCNVEMQSIVDENEGLRKGLQEILNFLKDNSTTSSGILSLECPSLDSVLQSMEARHAAGWFAPHMSTVMELRAALGGRDALLTALHQARKETFEVMAQLSKESQKSIQLEKKLHDIEIQQLAESETKKNEETLKIINGHNTRSLSNGEFGSWMSFEEHKIDFYDKDSIDGHISKRNSCYEDYLKQGLGYFHDKFKTLYEKITSIVVQTSDQQNQWSIQEEQYKAQIENLKGLLSYQEEEETSEDSPGILTIPSVSSLQRKCSYLEESYKYIRTLNENMKNEILEYKKESMLTTLDYETQTQSLLLIIANLFDKLRYSISIELFWKQNNALNEAVTNYRKILEENLKHNEHDDLLQYLENSKVDIISTIQKSLQQCTDKKKDLKNILNNAELTIAGEQLKQVISELEDKNNKIKLLETKNIELQKIQLKIIDENLAASTQDEADLIKSQLEKLAQDNKLLKEQCQHVESHLDIALLQLQDKQHRQLSYDIEINMLRHQILDLQATGDNKAIIARLSGEVLVAHLQASESHKKIERLNASLNKEKQSRFESEEMLKARQKIFDIYSLRYESKFNYMFEVMQILRQQYHGSLPLSSIENYLNKMEELTRKTYAVTEKFQEIEDLQYSLMTKHSVYDQVLDLSKNKCLEDEDGCPHKLKNMVLEGIQSREQIYFNKKLKTLEQSREELLKHCNKLENTLILVNQGFEKSNLDIIGKKEDNGKESTTVLKMEDIQSDDECSAKSDQTITLSRPRVLKPVSKESEIKHTEIKTNIMETDSSIKTNTMKKVDKKAELLHVSVQTLCLQDAKQVKSTQTCVDKEITALKDEIKSLRLEYDKIINELAETQSLGSKKSQEIANINAHKVRLETKLESLKESIYQKDTMNESLQVAYEELKKENHNLKRIEVANRNQFKDAANEESKSLLLTLKQSETDKNNILLEYKELLQNERTEYSKTMKELNTKIMKLQEKLDSKNSDANTCNADTNKEVISKYTLKIADLEDKCFKTQRDLEGYKTELITYQSELDRWKDLATERLSKMEHLKSQLEERHFDELESYKAENQHWLTQLNDTQREHMELRSRLSEQKALHIKQLADKDAIIEQLRSAVHGLKTQIISMQTMISVHDPSFDLSAIVEVEEISDGLSQHGSDRLELKFESTVDFQELPDDIVRLPASSTTIWQEPVIERLRREKQLAGKQNAILRRQIKALAARERRARLDAQNLKNQVFRISTCGSKAVTAESAALQSKISNLQAQLTSARRDTHSSIALWDKWKRAQQTSERWQARYEEKSQEVKKLEANLNLAKSAVARLEREKRLLLSKLAEFKNEKHLSIEKQESEMLEKSLRLSETERSYSPPPVSSRALLDRVQAQQRRIVALEVAEKGNERLISEYERALAEITSLKGQVLKLESTVLESQIRTPLKTTQDAQLPELEYWKSYCEMLKEENVQLNMRVNALDIAPVTANQHRVSDLEQTVLTLRGLVSKLQAEQKSTAVQKRSDSRPSSGRSVSTDKSRKPLDTHRIEIANLKRSIQDKDLLLEKSKEMLKIAAEREEELLRENAYLRRQLEELANGNHKEGFLSA